jgi:hypothetical protein
MSAKGGAYPDGMIASDAAGRVCRVFAPPWWAFWRWIAWARTPAAEKVVEERVVLVAISVETAGGVPIRFLPRRRRVRFLVVAERAS